MSFFRGVITGAAKSVDKNIQDQLKFLREETSNVAKIRANRAIREQDKYQDALDENLAEVKDLSRKVGGTDQFQFLLDKYGVAEAKVMAQQLYDLSQKDPSFNISEQLQIEEREGPSVSALQLARFMTPKAKVTPSGGYGIGTGMTRLLGIDADAKVKEQSDRLIKAAGIPTNETKYRINVPKSLAGEGVPSWRMIRSSNPLQDYNELASLAADKLKDGNEKEAKAIRAYAQTRLNASDTSVRTNKDFTSTQYSQYMASFMNALKDDFLALADKGDYQISPTGNLYITGQIDGDRSVALKKTINQLARVASKAQKIGISAAEIHDLSYEALEQNKKLSLIDGKLVLGNENDPLYNRKDFGLSEKEIKKPDPIVNGKISEAQLIELQDNYDFLISKPGQNKYNLGLGGNPKSYEKAKAEALLKLNQAREKFNLEPIKPAG